MYPVRFSMAECNATLQWNCSPSYNSNLYQVEPTTFIVRTLIVIFAIVTDLVVVIKASKETEQFKPRWWRLSNKCYRPVHIILLLNIFVAVLIIGFIAASILYLLHCGNNHPDETRIIICRCGRFLCMALKFCCYNWHSSYWSKFVVLQHATRRMSVRAVFGISLLPTVLLSLGSWIVRRKFLTMKNQHDPDAETRQRSGWACMSWKT